MGLSGFHMVAFYFERKVVIPAERFKRSAIYRIRIEALALIRRF